MNCGVLPQSLGVFQTTAGAGIEIRYNPRCRAAWARVWHSDVGDVLTITVAGQSARSARVPDAFTAQDFLYTPMVPVLDQGGSLRACLTRPSSREGPECFTAPAP
jgi:hypothetical protein